MNLLKVIFTNILSLVFEHAVFGIEDEIYDSLFKTKVQK